MKSGIRAVVPLSLAPLQQIARAMRAEDAREIYATRWDENPDAVARDSLLSRFGGIVALDGQPVAALGAIPATPGVFYVWMYATDAWPEVALTATKWALRSLKPALMANGHRAECRSIEGHHQAHAWLAMLGFRAECRLPDCGRHRETFIQFAWRKSDVHVDRSAPSFRPGVRPVGLVQAGRRQEGIDAGSSTRLGANGG